MLRMCILASVCILPALGEVSGRVVEVRSGNPLASVDVHVDGVFRICDLSSEDYRIRSAFHRQALSEFFADRPSPVHG